jgi:hypothetical protein
MLHLRRLVLSISACLLVPLLAHLWAAAPTLGVHGAATASGTTITLSPTGLTDGSTLAIGVSQTGSDADQSYSVADTNSNSYVSAVKSAYTTGTNANRVCQIFYAKNITTTAGATTITVTITLGTTSVRGQWVEVLGASTAAPLDQVSSFADSADTSSHNAAGTPGNITTASDVFVYSVMGQNAAPSTFVPTSSPAFTTLATDFDSLASVSQYYTNATGLSNSTVAWSTTGTARTAASCTAAFIAAATGGPARPAGLFSFFGFN